MKIVDLTHPLDHTIVVCHGHPCFSKQSVATIGQEHSPYNVHSLTMGSHSGTHIDAPYHFFDNGKSVGELDLNALMGPAVVVDLRGKQPGEVITWDKDLSPYEHRFSAGVIVLFCTGWSKYWGTPEYNDHPHLSMEGAKKLMDTGIRIIGMDMVSPDVHPKKGDEGACFDIHRAILGAGGVIAENLTNLEEALGLGAEMMASLLPLRIDGCDGSPIRAVAWSAHN